MRRRYGGMAAVLTTRCCMAAKRQAYNCRGHIWRTVKGDDATSQATHLAWCFCVSKTAAHDACHGRDAPLRRLAYPCRNQNRQEEPPTQASSDGGHHTLGRDGAISRDTVIPPSMGLISWASRQHYIFSTHHAVTTLSQRHRLASMPLGMARRAGAGGASALYASLPVAHWALRATRSLLPPHYRQTKKDDASVSARIFWYSALTAGVAHYNTAHCARHGGQRRGRKKGRGTKHQATTNIKRCRAEGWRKASKRRNRARIGQNWRLPTNGRLEDRKNARV